MTEQSLDFSPLTNEQLNALTDIQQGIFLQLDAKDRQFYAENFKPEALGNALNRKGELLESKARLEAFNQKVKQDMLTASAEMQSESDLNATDIGVGAAGVAGAVGMGVLASKIAPEGKATWRGVEPSDLIPALTAAFANQDKTDFRIEPPGDEDNRQAIVLVRTTKGLVPGLTILMTPLQDTIQVQISKLSSEGIMQMLRQGGLKLIDLVQYGLRNKRRGTPSDWLDLAGRAIDEGVDIAQIVKDLDLEDKAWEIIKNTADPIQTIYDERMKIELANRMKLQSLWDDYYACPKCKVEFGSDDQECRVCGTERPKMPDQADPRKNIRS